MAPLTWSQELTLIVAKILVLFGLILSLFAVMTWLERRVLAFMQFRLGPNRTGPFGLLQPLADGIKLFFKEEFVPPGANRWLFVAAPGLAVVTAFMSIAIVSFGGSVTLPKLAFLPAGIAWLWPDWVRGREVSLQIADLEIGVLYLFAVASLGVYGIVLAGWSANNKYTLFGGLRSSAQMFSYELALGLSWVTLVMLAGSFRVQDLVRNQDGPLGLLHWHAFVQFPAFVVYLIASTAEVNRTPFDLAEAETELVAGFHTEYSSMRFALLQMAEYVNMITVASLGTNLFLGGWLSPLPFLPDSPLWFLLKLFGGLFFFIWLRGTLPRFRYDQLMHFGWKVLLPVAILNIMATATVLVLA